MRLLLTTIFAVTTCSAALAKPAITMQSGKVAEDCSSYNELRYSERPREDIKNKLVASEYLECSLASNPTPVKNSVEVLQQFNQQLRIRQFPLSLGPRVSRRDLLKLKFTYADNSSLIYVDGNHHVSIALKGEIAERRYLVWVTDEILDATYRSYYPAVVVRNGTDFKVEPYYASGF